ncbi:hypothetical protein RCH21_000307 [Arthrobacter sp. PL16]|uniref:DUF4129 domain-containing protein n=1 Tax=Arthrobacter sp. PL16 TaxID=3071720 RepID=UPI002DFE7B17|nr:hypothetical protein [Arthrobacter sp. PL16]
MGTKGTPRHAKAALGVPALLTVLVLVLTVVAAGFIGRFTAQPVVDPPVDVVGQESTATPSATVMTEPPADSEPLVISGDTAAAALLILAMAGLALLVRFLLRFRRRHIAGSGFLEQADLQQPGTLALVNDALPAWTEATRTALAGDADTSDAVIRCWLDFEHLCAVAGAGRTPAQTTSDFATAVAAGLDLPAEPLTSLNRLYQRARFGRTDDDAPQRLGHDDRELALSSVIELSIALAAHRRIAG